MKAAVIHCIRDCGHVRRITGLFVSAISLSFHVQFLHIASRIGPTVHVFTSATKCFSFAFYNSIRLHPTSRRFDFSLDSFTILFCESLLLRIRSYTLDLRKVVSSWLS